MHTQSQDESVQISDSLARNVKHVLKGMLPAVSLGHLNEAAARGFGHRTRAALTAALKGGTALVGVDDAAFRARLADFGHEAPEGTFPRAVRLALGPAAADPATIKEITGAEAQAFLDSAPATMTMTVTDAAVAEEVSRMVGTADRTGYSMSTAQPRLVERVALGLEPAATPGRIMSLLRSVAGGQPEPDVATVDMRAGPVLVYAGARAGFSGRIVEPTVTAWTGPVVCVDHPERLQGLRERLRKGGRKVLLLDLNNPGDDRWNLLSVIRRDRGVEVFVADCWMFARHVLLKSPKPAEELFYWRERACGLAAIAVAGAMTDGSERLASVLKRLFSAPAEVKEWLEAMASNKALGPLAKDAAALLECADQTFEAMLQTLRLDLSDLATAAVERMTDAPLSRDGLADGASLLVAPGVASQGQCVFANAIAMGLNRPQAEPTFVAVSEIAAIPPVFLPSIWGLGRGNAVYLLLRAQSEAQIRRVWGDEAVSDLSEAGAVLALGVGDQETTHMLSKRAGLEERKTVAHSVGDDGQRAISHSVVCRPFVTADEILRSNKILVIPRGR